MLHARRTIALVIVAACSGDPAPTPVVAPPPPPADAAVDGVTMINGYDPRSGMHLDDDAPMAAARPAAKRAGRTIEIMLRSTPSGARVHVDGNFINVTPTMWTGETGEHEFTFVLPKHALARYRFHAVAAGIVHARLDPVEVERDAGKPPPEIVRPPQIAPPPTLLVPDASAPLLDDQPQISPPSGPPSGPAPAPQVPVGPQP